MKKLIRRSRYAVIVAAIALAPEALLALTNFKATMDSTNLDYSFSYTGTPAQLRVFIDSDKNASTGYYTATIGSDYLIENGVLYKFSGATRSTWGWTKLGSSNMVNTAPNVRWQIARSAVGNPTSLNVIANTSAGDKSEIVTQTMPATTWTFCANENETCIFTGTRTIRYGANTTWVTKTLAGPVACNNSTFGDPLVGVAKRCELSSTTTSPSPSPSPSPRPSPSPSPSPSPTPIAKRDPLKQPFKSTSIWNMPIGSNAVYVNANISGSPAGNIWAKMPGVDNEHIIMTPNAPEEDLRRSNVGWSGGDRCVYTSTEILGKIPIPDGYTVQNSRANNSTAALLKDGRTLLQFQPITRCNFGGYITSYTTPTKTDIYSDGITGSHGGSGLSAIGGSIRLGELRPQSAGAPLEGPKHALKVNVWAAAVLYKCTTKADCYRWPATTGDSYAVGTYGTYNNNLNTAMKMGALLAIPRSVSISSLGLETTPAKQLAWTLQNYGAYIVDDTAAPGFDFNLETGPGGSKEAEFQSDWGFPFMQKVEAAGRSPWVRDIQKIVQALKAVNNNSATSIGGGGTPLQPLAPEITAP